jgi:hypothetical protein
MSERYLISPCCQAAIDLLTAGDDRVSCPECRRAFEIREDIDFAEFSTSSTESYRWADDYGHVVRFFFENFTLDALERTAQRIKILRPSERRPTFLLPIFKDMHDCMKKRLQQYLIRDDVPILSAKVKAQIELDEPSHNLSQLCIHLLSAYPNEGARLKPLVEHDYIKMLVWLRNKEEHLPVSAWPLRSYVHTARDKRPDDLAGAYAELTVGVATLMHNFSVDFLKAIYDVCGRDIEDRQHNLLEAHRIHCTV